MENILTPNEILIMQMSLQQTIDDLAVNLNNPALPFSPDARKDMRDMYNTAVSAKAKLAKVPATRLRWNAIRTEMNKSFSLKNRNAMKYTIEITQPFFMSAEDFLGICKENDCTATFIGGSRKSWNVSTDVLINLFFLGNFVGGYLMKMQHANPGMTAERIEAWYNDPNAPNIKSTDL